MLQNIRDKAQGWIAYGIVILISVPFALWGIQEYLGIGSEPLAATVNGTEITERNLDTQFQNFRQQLRERMGGAYRPELFDDKTMRREVLNRMVRDELIEQASHEMGLRVSDIEVQSALLGIQEFHKDGRFDQKTFETRVRYQGLTPAGFMERVRKMLLSQQLIQVVSASTFMTEHEKNQAYRLMNQTREFSYFVVPAADYLVDTPISDDKIESYYSEHQAEFAVPERVKLSYIHLDAKSAGSTLEVSEDQLRSFYDDNQDMFGLPEQRRVSHILIQLAEESDEATVSAAKAKIEALGERLAQGEDFNELAKSQSQDPGSAEKGGDLGYFSKGMGMMDPAFELATFALQPGQISEPVRSSFGYHLIKLVDIRSGEVKPFEEAKAEVEKAYRMAEGERLYYELAERLANLSYDHSDTLEPAATELGLSVRQSDWVSRRKGEGVLASPKALNAAFSDDVLVEGNNSELIELGADSSLVLRVDEHEMATTQPLAEVRDRIVEKLRQENAKNQAQAEADKRRQEIESGTSLTQVAGDLSVTGPLTLERNDRSVPVELSSDVFSAAKPAEGGETVGSIRLTNGDVAVYTLNQVIEGSVKEDQEDQAADMLVQSLNRQLQSNLYEALIADLEAQADIEILLKETPDSEE
jgi:peptidyl-prolyl cis-trans isomerase D